jgi:hypothetical protein
MTGKEQKGFASLTPFIEVIFPKPCPISVISLRLSFVFSGLANDNLLFASPIIRMDMTTGGASNCRNNNGFSELFSVPFRHFPFA